LVVDNQQAIDLKLDAPEYETLSGDAKKLTQLTHQTIQGVSHDITEAFQFNTVISKIREFTNELGRYPVGTTPDAVFTHGIRVLLSLLAPIAPHITEELWARLSGEGSVYQQPWPTFNPKALVADTVEVVFQVNGKVRDKVNVANNTPKGDLEALALGNERVQKFMDGKAPLKVIVVPNKLVNIVVPQ